ncbi:DUF1361 domain-containing protein [Anaerolineae bacterium CFX7]|nr:DUF1361 domain-containing protein [Anaerolineae bacterium CFX7]
MQQAQSHLASVSHFLREQLFYPVLLSSLLGVAFFAVHALWSDSFAHKFLMWNLGLAWIPYLCALAMAALHERRARAWQYVIPALAWLLFFPAVLVRHCIFCHAGMDRFAARRRFAANCSAHGQKRVGRILELDCGVACHRVERCRHLSRPLFALEQLGHSDRPVAHFT